VAYADALAYANWAGKDLPTKAESKFAARGGFDGAEFAWRDELSPDGRQMANTWQGNFPFENLALDGYERTSPVTPFRVTAMKFTIRSATAGNGRRIGSNPGIRPILRKPVASL
jgi:formylglycine-generating enzyme required for sulfatase activity